jgi:hypothetical protein
MSFLSPGLGPFSPTLNSPTNFGFNPFHAAPGAPLMTPGVPHPMNNMGNGYGAPGGQHISHTPGHGHSHHQSFAQTPGAPMRRGEAELDYFPSVQLQKYGAGDGFFTGDERFGDYNSKEKEQAGLGLDALSDNDLKRLSNVSTSSVNTALGSIREQVESLVLSADSTSSATGRKSDASESLVPGVLGSNSRASFNLGIGGRDALAELLGNQQLGLEKGERERDRRASMDDGKRP